ncbi:MAG: nucleoside transporter C-terminal domain-containing protein [Cellulosilyticaceae bacterium]
MEKIFAILGLVLIIGGTYFLSNNKNTVNWKSVTYAFLAQFLLAFLLIKTPLWKLVECLGNGVSWILAQSSEGISFVFGGLVPDGEFVFFINGLLPIVFISALIGLLFHYGIIAKFVIIVGNTVAKFLKIDTLVAVNGITNTFLGQSDALFVTKSYLPHANENVIFATLVGGMTSVSISVIGLYTSLGASIEWILISIPLTVFSTFVLTQILMPTTFNKDKLTVETPDKGLTAIETMMNYAYSGFKSVINIAVALMVFISIIFMINNFIGLFFDGFTLQSLLGFLFKPLAFIMGVPPAEVTYVSEIFATKLVINETAAIGLPTFALLSTSTKAMVTVALMGFAGIGSVGILIASYSVLAPSKVPIVAKLGIRALICASLVNIMTGAIVGLFL